MELSKIVKRIQNIMRNDAGINGDAQRIEQLVWILFLKVYDSKEEIWEFHDNQYHSIIEEKYRWRNWAIDNKDGNALTGDELLDFINNGLFVNLKNIKVDEFTPLNKLIVKSVFEDNNNYMKDGILLRQVINIIDEIDFSDYDDRHAFGEIYETILLNLQSAGNAGEFYTPRALTDFMVEMVNPDLGQRVADFACGTGGFLTSTINHLALKVKSVSDRALLNDSIYGVEKKALPFLLCVTNLLLHEIDFPKVFHGNSLEKNVRDYKEMDKFDVILMNPPYGGNEKESIKVNFPLEFRSSETYDLFMVEILFRLKSNGKAAVILPDGFLNGDGNVARIKEKMLSEFNLHTIIRLPNTVFSPYATVATNILFFDKTKSTDGVWYYEHQYPEGKRYSKTNMIKNSDFNPIRSWWEKRVDTKDSWYISLNEIVNNGYNLDSKNPYKIEIIHKKDPQEILLEIKELFNELLFEVNEIEENLKNGLSYDEII